MCAIAGIFNVNGRAVSIEALRKMSDAVAHRGPDGEGFWTNAFVGLAHRRLAIIDLSPMAHQPMQSEDGSIVLTYNGEIYNYQNLRVELQSHGHRFVSQSDTEVILKAYEEWGEGCISKFNGMFAFALWDGRRNKLVLARDRFGIKPLYYYFANGSFIFGSEIKSILKHPSYHFAVSPEALNEYFTFQNILSDLTLFEGIRMLPAASILSLQLGNIDSIKVEPYWDRTFTPNPTFSLHETEEELSRLFEQAVKRQLVSDVEIGSYLSGGIDSASVTCIAAAEFKNLKTFTCGFDLSSAQGLELVADERRKAEALSNLYKTEHYEVVLKAGDMERVMGQLIWHLEDLRVGQSYPNFYVARLASKFVKVALSGVGGDELFAGYPWRYYPSTEGGNLESFYQNYYSYWQRLVRDDQKKSFFVESLNHKIDPTSAYQKFKSVFPSNIDDASNPSSLINLALHFEFRTFLRGLLVVEDKLSMAHGLETRVPFLDNDLVDLALSIPVHFKLSRNALLDGKGEKNESTTRKEEYYRQTNDGKKILRNVLSRWVPDHVSRGLKQGFAAPDGSWFKGESIDYIHQLLLSRKARIYDYIEPTFAKNLLENHFSGQTNSRLMIWSLLCFEWWLKTFDE